MERLRELERVQKTILLMQSRGVIDDSSHTNNNSNRFLANFTLFLLQPCGNLDMDRKCQLISECFPKISAAFLEEASLQLCDKGNEETNNSPPNHSEDEADIRLLRTESDDMAMVGLDSMQRANSTLEDFCRSYFMFHEMDADNASSIFSYLPLLSFTESYIYQLDSLNEKLQQSPISGIPAFDRGSESDWGANRSWILKFLKLFRTDPFRPLAVLLEQHGLLTEQIREEFKCGEEYWALERKLCCALASKQEIPLVDVMRAIHLKSFDYRVLNLLLYRLRGEKVNEKHMEFLSVSEFLVEVSDDLFDYEDDVLENNFNILRMFVRIYGASTAPTMLAKSITEAEEEYNRLLNCLDPKLSFKYQERCEEATKEGGKVFGPPLGTWSIPPVIEDEDLYRHEVSNTVTPVVPRDDIKLNESRYKPQFSIK